MRQRQYKFENLCKEYLAQLLQNLSSMSLTTGQLIKGVLPMAYPLPKPTSLSKSLSVPLYQLTA